MQVVSPGSKRCPVRAGRVDLSSFSFMDKQLWVTRYHPGERFPEANIQTVLLMTPVLDNTVKITVAGQHRRRCLDDHRHHTCGRAEEWPIMPTEWVHTLLKPWTSLTKRQRLGR